MTTVYSSSQYQFDLATETAYNSGVILLDLNYPGIGSYLSTYEPKNAWTPVMAIGQRYPGTFFSAGEDALVTLNFVLCQDRLRWLGLVLTEAGTVAPYSYSVGNTVSTGQVILQTPQSINWRIGGIGFSTAKIHVEEQKTIDVTLTGVGAASFGTVAGTINPTTPSGILTWKDVTTVSGETTATVIVKTLDLTIETGYKEFYGLGSLVHQAGTPLESKISCKINAYHNDNDMSGIFGTSPGPLGTITIVMGTITAALTGSYLKGVTVGGLQGVQPVIDEFDIEATNISITGISG